jgi:hypothetical protein
MKWHLWSISIVTVIALAHGHVTAHAQDPLFQQTPLVAGDGYLSDPAGDQVADDFSLASNSDVQAIRWWGTYLGDTAEPDDFSIRFFVDVGGDQPNKNPHAEFSDLDVSRTDSGLDDSFGDPIYEYQATLPFDSVPSGVTLSYVSITNATDNGWFWQQSDTSGTNWFRFAEEDQWQSGANGNLAFALLGATPLRGDFNRDGVLDALDINDLTQRSAAMGNPNPYDLTGDNVVNADDVEEWITAPDIFNSWLGDANLDGEFGTSDLVDILAAGLYETGEPAVWTEGDFNGSGFFDTQDLITALAGGGYELGQRPEPAVVPEPSGAVLLALGTLAVLGCGRWL